MHENKSEPDVYFHTATDEVENDALGRIMDIEAELKAILGDTRYVFYLEFDGNEFVLLEKHDMPISTHEYARGANLKELIESYKARDSNAISK